MGSFLVFKYYFICKYGYNIFMVRDHDEYLKYNLV
jgi:hypothetical protein